MVLAPNLGTCIKSSSGKFLILLDNDLIILSDKHLFIYKVEYISITNKKGLLN